MYKREIGITLFSIGLIGAIAKIFVNLSAWALVVVILVGLILLITDNPPSDNKGFPPS